MWPGKASLAPSRRPGMAPEPPTAATGSLRWLHQDRQGSVIAVSDAAGVVTPYAYGPYGEPQSWAGSRLRYTGQMAIPEAQLYHYRARAYDPLKGRFLQTDPIGYGDGPNVYAYVHGDPVNGTDPSGEDAWIISRPIAATGFQGYHSFVVVGSSLDNITNRYSFGPDNGTGRNLVFLTGNVTSDTNKDDANAIQNWSLLSRSGVISIQKLTDPDFVIVGRGELLKSSLGDGEGIAGTSPVEYTLLPMFPSEANSNSAAAAIGTGGNENALLLRLVLGNLPSGLGLYNSPGIFTIGAFGPAGLGLNSPTFGFGVPIVSGSGATGGGFSGPSVGGAVIGPATYTPPGGGPSSTHPYVPDGTRGPCVMGSC